MKHIPTLLLGTILAVTAAVPAEASPTYHGPSHSSGYRPGPPPPPPAPVYPSHQRKEVRAQFRLRQLGYYQGRIDGSIGPMTQRAIARFQRDHRLHMTGWLDYATLRALRVV
ncbi:MAG: peptidoglycan-binding domain-containing protein [Luteolibacter sp.]